MANLRLLLSRSTKQSQTLIRSLSSSPVPIKPVSYPVKPKPPEQQEDRQESPPPSSHQSQPPPSSSWRQREEALRPWTREDARFVKDASSIAPVSYPTRVAPLPEDRTKEERQLGEEGELTREARMIESGGRVTNFWGIQEEEKIPFPTMVKQEKRPRKLPIDLSKAIQEVKANAKCNFVETVEAHVNLGVDPRRGDQMVRGALTLPHGTGKTVRVAVFAEGAAADEAREAGADIVGGDELIEEIKKGGGSKLHFDKCITTPMFMPRLSKIGKVLGPRGLMPNPKLGSVTSDILGAVKSAKSSRLDFRIDKTAIVHVGLGKVNFSEEALRENVGAFVNALLLAKPVGLKKTSKYVGYVKNFTLSSTMGPGYPVSIQSLSVAADSYNKLHGK